MDEGMPAKRTRKVIDLDGEWEYSALGFDAISGNGRVPGSLFLDLMHDGHIPDPFTGRHEESCSWIFATPWIYRKRFVLNDDFLGDDELFLVAEGIDTLAHVHVDGIEVGFADNMFRQWEWRLPAGLNAGEHLVEVRFLPLTREVGSRRASCPLNGVGIGTFRLDGAQWLRKAAYHFGWDWGPKLPDSGIWKPIRIEERGQPGISGAYVRQKHLSNGSVTLIPMLDINRSRENDLAVEWELCDPDGYLTQGIWSLPLGIDAMRISVDSPKLWWPQGMGSPDQYRVTFRLINATGMTLDEWQTRIGLRTVKLDTTPDTDGHRFSIIVNGSPLLVRGANWIPADQFLPRVGPEVYRNLLRSAELANMNMIRVWGGGVYEADVFYDLCDEYGLLVWQDFMYACSAYPAQDDTWLANAVAEAKQQVQRLRNHPCIALYCGNNEMEQFPNVLSPEPMEGAMSPDTYARLFESALPRVVNEEHPEAPYWASSPHSLHGMEATSPSCGDVHIWNVWWGMKPFQDYRSMMPRFCSEFGFQSLPHPKTIFPVLESVDCTLAGEAMAFRQRGSTHLGPGNTTLLRYMELNLGIPESGEAQLWRTQVLQGMALETGCEAWLAEWPYCSGVLYWQLNDCWPGPSWSTIDYNGIWKVAHYAIRRMFQPTVLLWRQRYSEKEGKPCSPLVLRLLHSARANRVLDWHVERRDLNGAVLESASGHKSVHAEGIWDLFDASSWPDYAADDCFLPASLYENSNEVSRRIWFPSRIPLDAMKIPGLTLRLLNQRQVAIRASGECPALWVWLEGDDPKALFSDNAFHLFPGEEKVITCMERDALPANLGAKSLLMLDSPTDPLKPYPKGLKHFRKSFIPIDL